MSLAELLRHGQRFIGCMAIARIGPQERTLAAADAAAFNALAQTLFHRSAAFGNDWIVLTLRGYEYASLGRCSALADDGRCTLHETGKPAMCEAVPLDPLLPNTACKRGYWTSGAKARNGWGRTVSAREMSRTPCRC
jgi:hypothetical protein